MIKKRFKYHGNNRSLIATGPCLHGILQCVLVGETKISGAGLYEPGLMIQSVKKHIMNWYVDTKGVAKRGHYHHL
jgi:hypothetical protein